MEVLVDLVNQPEAKAHGLVEVRGCAPIPQFEQAVLELLIVLEVVVEGGVGADYNLRIQRTSHCKVRRKRKLLRPLQHHQVPFL
ncbi:hypothetical protein D3C78_1540080 [compost metagenome]